MAVGSAPSGAPAVLTEMHRQRYLAWYVSHRQQIGNFEPEHLLETLSAIYEEAVQSGIDTPSRLFIYTTARILMPDMKAPRYIVTMDIVFNHRTEKEKIDHILRLSRMTENETQEKYQ